MLINALDHSTRSREEADARNAVLITNLVSALTTLATAVQPNLDSASMGRTARVSQLDSGNKENFTVINNPQGESSVHANASSSVNEIPTSSGPQNPVDGGSDSSMTGTDRLQ